MRSSSGLIETDTINLFCNKSLGVELCVGLRFALGVLALCALTLPVFRF
jgi:hypothetical protein